MVVSTYGPGELSTFCGLGGAHGENVKVVSLTGMPGLSEWTGQRVHHMISDQQPNYDLFVKMVSPLTAGGDSAAVITPENCVYETERLIAAMMYHSKPINLAFPRDVPNQPVVMPQGELKIPLANSQSDPDALDAVVREILYRVGKAKQACILPGYLVRRYDCLAEARALIEASGLPFVSSIQDKGVLPESHPQFAGVYQGRWEGLADPAVTEFVEACDCIIGLGPENHEFNNAFHTMEYDFKETMNITPHHTRVGMATYDKVEMKDVLSALAQQIPNRKDVTGLSYAGSVMKLGAPSGVANDAITYEPLFERFQTFLKPNDILVSDTSITAICGTMRYQLPDGLDLESGTSWGSIGWGTPEILGNCIAAPDRRCILVAGEGGHQMTANEIGTFYRYGAKPISRPLWAATTGTRQKCRRSENSMRHSLRLGRLAPACISRSLSIPGSALKVQDGYSRERAHWSASRHVPGTAGSRRWRPIRSRMREEREERTHVREQAPQPTRSKQELCGGRRLHRSSGLHGEHL